MAPPQWPFSCSICPKRAPVITCKWLLLVCCLVLSCKGKIICKCSNSSCNVEAELVTSVPVFESGTNLTATCSLLNATGRHCDFTSQAIYFKYLGKKVPPKYVSIVNETSAHVNIPDVKSEEDGAHMYCYVQDYINRLGNGVEIPMYIGQAVVNIADLPAEPQFIGCVVYNWLSMNCTWEPAEPGIHHTLSWTVIRGQGVDNCPIQKANSCFWPSVEDEKQTVTSFKRDFVYHLEIKAKNIIGNKSVSFVDVPTKYKESKFILFISNYQTGVTAWICKLSHIRESVGYFRCPIASETSCSWRHPYTPAQDSFMQDLVYYIWLEAVNILGQASYHTTIHTHTIVKPAMVTPNINISSTKLGLLWHSPIPVSIKYRQRLLLYNVKVIQLDKVIKYEVNITTVNLTIDHVVSGLNPYTQYSVILSCIPVFHDEPSGFWSDSDGISLMTHPDVPGAAPALTPGGYTVIQRNKTHSRVKVHWQPIHPEDVHGADLNTRIQAFKLSNNTAPHCSGHQPDLSFTSIGGYSAELLLDCNEMYTVCVDVSNEMGYNTSSVVTPLVIPLTLEVPRVLEFYAEGDGNNISVRWTTVDTASGYTVYWCTGLPLYLCSKKHYFAWKHYSNTSHSAQLTLPVDVLYQSQVIGLSAEHYDAHGTAVSSGMHVTDCIFPEDKDPAMPTDLHILEPQYGQNSLAVKWTKPKCDMTGYVKFFSLTYCKEDMCQTQVEDSLVPVERHLNGGSQEHVLSNLDTDVTYLVRIASVGDNNKTSAYTEAVVGHVIEQGLTSGQKVMVWLAVVLGIIFIGAGITSATLYVRKKWKKRFAPIDIIIPDDVNEHLQMMPYATSAGVYTEPLKYEVSVDTYVADHAPMLPNKHWPNGDVHQDPVKRANGCTVSNSSTQDRSLPETEALLSSEYSDNSSSAHHPHVTNIDSYNLVAEKADSSPVKGSTAAQGTSGDGSHLKLSSATSSGTDYIPSNFFISDSSGNKTINSATSASSSILPYSLVNSRAVLDVSDDKLAESPEELNNDAAITDKESDKSRLQSVGCDQSEAKQAVESTEEASDVTDPKDIIHWDTNIGEVTISQKKDNITCSPMSSGSDSISPLSSGSPANCPKSSAVHMADTEDSTSPVCVHRDSEPSYINQDNSRTNGDLGTMDAIDDMDVKPVNTSNKNHSISEHCHNDHLPQHHDELPPAASSGSNRQLHQDSGISTGNTLCCSQGHNLARPDITSPYIDLDTMTQMVK